jgi:hypothetical protein
MIDETSIDIVISGLKGLYEKLARKEQAPEEERKKASAEQQMLWFDSEKDKCLLSLKELFMHRVNANREKRLK